MSNRVNGLIKNVMQPFPTLDGANWTYWLNTFTEIYYVEYKLKKKTGLIRTVSAPCTLLKELQKDLLQQINKKFKTHPLAFATKGQDYIQNALVHQGATELFRLDIQEFYPSCTIKQLLSVIKDSELLDFVKENVPLLFASLPSKKPEQNKFSQKHFSLPTGAPASPVIANLALFSLDEKLEKLSKEYGASYTRYLDDITISFKEELSIEKKAVLQEEITKLVTDDKWKINQLKTGWLNPSKDAFTVTGVDLRSQPKVTNRYIKEKLRPFLNRAAQKRSLGEIGQRLYSKKLITPEQFQTFSFLDYKTRGTLAYVKAISPEQYEVLRDYFFYRLERITKKELSLRWSRIDSSLNQLQSLEAIKEPSLAVGHLVKNGYSFNRFNLAQGNKLNSELSEELQAEIAQLYFKLKDMGMYHCSAVTWTAHYMLPKIYKEKLPAFRVTPSTPKKFSNLLLAMKIPEQFRVEL